MRNSEQTRGASVGMFYLWTIMVITIAIILTSCGASKGCHNKGYYVSKDIKKAQSRVRH